MASCERNASKYGFSNSRKSEVKLISDQIKAAAAAELNQKATN